VKKVLIITYYWPPSGGAGVQRWLKFTKYLPESGIEPVILTVDPEYASYPQRDASLLKEIPGNIKIIYTRSSRGIFNAYKKLTGKEEVPYGGFVNESEPGLLQKILRFIRGNFFLPDARRGWNHYAFKAGLKAIEEYKIDIVITTSPPHSTQLTGLKLKRKKGIKWIADLRDPWTDIYYTDKMFQTLPAKRINRRLESLVLNNADRVIATCDATRDVFRSKLQKGQSPEKVITITNGFDPDDFTSHNIIPEKFIITYLGTLAGNYNIEVLTTALANLQPPDKTGIILRFIGRADEKVLAKISEESKVTIERIPYVDHRKAMDYLAGSAALLIVIPADRKSNEMIPGKLFEYLASRRPVIAIGPGNSDTGAILKETNAGRIFGNTQAANLEEYIRELITKFKAGQFETEPSGIENYSRPVLAGRIAEVISFL